MAKVTFGLHFKCNPASTFADVQEFLVESTSLCDVCEHGTKKNEEFPCNLCLVLLDGEELEVEDEEAG